VCVCACVRNSNRIDTAHVVQKYTYLHQACSVFHAGEKQLQQNLVCIRATLDPIHIMNNTQLHV
jgi:hypothetical protein